MLNQLKPPRCPTTINFDLMIKASTLYCSTVVTQLPGFNTGKMGFLEGTESIYFIHGKWPSTHEEELSDIFFLWSLLPLPFRNVIVIENVFKFKNRFVTM